MRGTWLLVSAVAGCSLAAEPIDPADLEVAGCASVLAGPVCALGAERHVSIWLRAAPASGVAFRAGGREIEATRVDTDDGARFALAVPAGVTELSISLDQPTRRRHTVRLARAPVFERVDSAQAQRRGGHPERASAELTAALPSMGAPERAAALGVLGRIALASGRTGEGIDLLDQARARDLEVGCLSCALWDGTALAYTLTLQLEIQRARTELARLARDCAGDTETRVYLPYFEGVLDYESGDLRSSMRALERSRRAASRQGNDRLRRAAAQMMSLAAQALGDHARAARLLGELRADLSPEGDACERAALSNNLGWVSLLQADALRQGAPAPTAEAELRTALELYRTGCPRADEEPNVLVNLAFAALLRGDLLAARSELAESERGRLRSPRLRVWQLDLAGRIALAAGNPALAAARFDELDALAASIDAVEARWRAAQGKARALWAMGRRDDALAAFALAEELLDEAAERVALGDGRDSFYTFYAGGTADYLERLLTAGRVREAVEVARRGRSRLLQSMARLDRLQALPAPARSRWDEAVGHYRREREELEREASTQWQLATDARVRQAREHAAREARLRVALDEAFAALGGGASRAGVRPEPEATSGAPPPGELVLVYYPVSEGWVGMALDAQAATSARLTASDLARPERMLGPFDGAIERASRIRVIAVGAAEAVDLHAADWHGAPLVAKAAVAYGQDSATVASPPGFAGERHATVLGDPSGRLPAARGEADDVRAALLARDWRVDTLVGSRVTAATASAAASDSMLLHYAGHGAAPPDPWQSGLPMAHGSFLSIGDILTLPRVPRVVVLAACDTARARGSTVSGVGVAQAFLSAGAGAAIAAARDIDDREGRELARAFYRHLVTLDGWGVAEALRRAQLERAAHVPAAQWAALRALLP